MSDRSQYIRLEDNFRLAGMIITSAFCDYHLLLLKFTCNFQCDVCLDASMDHIYIYICFLTRVG